MNTHKILKSLILITLFISLTQAAIYRVNGLGGADADYTTIQDAHDGAADGDTLLIEGYPTYAGWTATKKLTYIGPGYFLGENPETQANTTPATILTGNTMIDEGAEGSVLTGLNFIYRIYIYADSTILKRNYFSHYLYIGDGNTSGKNPSDIVVKQNYFSFSSSSYYINIFNYCHNILFFNNFIYQNSGPSSYYCLNADQYTSTTVDHNIVRGKVKLYNSVFSNNIMIEGVFEGDYNGYYNNLVNSTQLTTDNNNQPSITMTDVFTYDGSTDGQYQLKTGSSAIGADAEGGDCGIFGGSDPYVLSGVPLELPTIYYFYNSGSGTTVSGLPIHLKAKTRD